MALDNLSGQRIQETYQKLVQTEGGSFATGDGQALGIVTDNETGSFAVKSAISGAFANTSASIQSRVTILEASASYPHGVFHHVTASGNISSSGTGSFNHVRINNYSLPSTDGTEGQFITTDGSGNLSFDAFATEQIQVRVRNVTGIALSAGTPIYSVGEQGDTGRIKINPASASDATTLPAIGILESDLANNSNGIAVVSGIYNFVSPITPVGSDPNLGDNIYVHADGGLTVDKPTGANLIQNIGTVIKVAGQKIKGIKVSSIDRTNDVPNLMQGQIFFGTETHQTSQIHISGALNTTIINNITASNNISASGVITANSFTGTFKGALSSSTQIKTEISGAFDEVSSSFASRLDGFTTDYTELINIPVGILSSSAQIKTEITGAFHETSHSLQSRVTTNASDISSLTNATSSYLLNTTDTIAGDLTITGKLIAEQYIVSSSVTLMTQSFSSGSTIFGDDTSDTHQFTGSVFISGSSLKINGDNVLTESPFTPTAISGAFNGVTSSFLTESPFTPTAISGAFNGVTSSFLTESPFTPTAISESLGTNAVLIRSLTATSISSSFNTVSHSLQSRVTSVESSGGGTGVGFPYSGSDVITSNDNSAAVITGSLFLSGSGNVIANGYISASGLLFISASTTASALNTLMYDTATGQVYYTGSYGGGSGATGGTGAGFPFEGNAVITGSLIVSGTAVQDVEIFNDILPGDSDEYTLGTSTKKWNAVFATNTFFGGIHEINLETIGISQLQTGTVLVSKAGQMVPCDTKGDALVMGVVTSGSDYPVVMGAEPVLVDGPVYEGDYIITSNRIGYGTAVPPDKIYEQRLFGKIIAQSLETNLSGGSIKAMIRKM